MKTGLNASKLAIAAFLVPYIFVMNPQMLLFNINFLSFVWMLITSLIGIVAVASAVNGWLMTNTVWYERILGFVGGVLLIDPGLTTDLIGIGLVAILFISQFLRSKKLKVKPSP